MKTPKRWNILAPLLSLGLLMFGGAAMAVEEPKYTAVVRDGAFEVRDYPELIVAEVTVTGEQKEAANKGFRLLAKYIFGGNRKRKGVAMTAPVSQQRAGEQIAMTAPVAQVKSGEAWIVRFTMPRKYSLETLPEPNDPRVKLHRTPPRRLAVLRFSGIAEPAAVATRTAELMTAIRNHHLKAAGPVTLAQYDPPWTLWFMRRNEVMAPVTAE